MGVSDGFHDGSDGKAIGAGDQVFNEGTRAAHASAAAVRAAFDCTAASITSAALYDCIAATAARSTTCSPTPRGRALREAPPPPTRDRR